MSPSDRLPERMSDYGDDVFESRERYLEELYWEKVDREYESARDAELDLLDNACDDYDMPF